MHIPAKVRITSKVSYEVLFVDSFPETESCIQHGECRSDSKQIVLRKGMSTSLEAKTFIHECLHAIEFETSPIPHKYVEQLESGIYRVLRLNGWLK